MKHRINTGDGRKGCFSIVAFNSINQTAILYLQVASVCLFDLTFFCLISWSSPEFLRRNFILLIFSCLS